MIRSWPLLGALGRSWAALTPKPLTKNLPSCERKAAQANVIHYFQKLIQRLSHIIRYFQTCVAYFCIVFVQQRDFHDIAVKPTKTRKLTLLAALEALLGALLAALGALLAALGRSWAALGRSWPLLSRSWPLLAALGPLLVALRRLLGRS